MAGKIIAQLIVSGVTMFTKAFFSAYQQALRNAKAGGAPAAASAVATKFKMRPDEALKIMNIEKGELTKKLLDERFKTMFAMNDPAKGGSFYIQSKIYRSNEVLEKEVLGITDEPTSETGEKPAAGDTPSNNNEGTTETKNNRKD
mmetsp:Transcript_48937/g.96921  ORF Transcript_48937/g.96921 Transcript_48937/m.96921 type:complete len:145 (+) Transcript_48937:27-461(+)